MPLIEMMKYNFNDMSFNGNEKFPYFSCLLNKFRLASIPARQIRYTAYFVSQYLCKEKEKFGSQLVIS